MNLKSALLLIFVAGGSNTKEKHADSHAIGSLYITDLELCSYKKLFAKST
jgi:hypothetical protein